uniref:(northern house mosquito) hypothetical protein n=1 Tax=Culex pipiens TaxID=7175 RepID=A0A8D8ILZ9_CULPI
MVKTKSGLAPAIIDIQRRKKSTPKKSTLLKVSQHANYNALKNRSNITDHTVQRLAENEVPKPSIWYSTPELQFFTNQAGRKWVRFRNFEYTCQDVNDRVVTFKIQCNCSVIRCKATATIDGQNNIRFSHRPHRHRKTEKVPDIWTATTLDAAPTQEENEQECLQVKNEPVDLELL